MRILVEVISGRAGPCLTIGDEGSATRVAGPKTYGGGSTIYKFSVDVDVLRAAVDEYADRAAEGGDHDQ